MGWTPLEIQDWYGIGGWLVATCLGSAAYVYIVLIRGAKHWEDDK